MQIRRGLDSNAIEVGEGERWQPLASADPAIRAQLQWLCDLNARSSPQLAGLPFAPASFRDCMLYERHWIQSSRGYTRRFMPRIYRLASIYEKVTGSVFPAFRPNRLMCRQPAYYFGNHLTFVASGAPIRVPEFSQALDYELELGLVLARPLRDATPEEAEEAIGGFVVVNDWSARDVQRAEMRTGLGPQKAKHFISSMSSTMALPGGVLPRIDDLRATVEINGAKVASTSTAGMLHSLGELVAYLSTSERLFPGELIATGTLPDGSGMENGAWVAPGDTLTLSIEGVGRITHRIVAS